MAGQYLLLSAEYLYLTVSVAKHLTRVRDNESRTVKFRESTTLKMLVEVRLILLMLIYRVVKS